MVDVNLQTVHSRTFAAVRCEVAPGAVGSAWGPALAKVWPFIRSQQGLWTDGHNIFLYHHPAQPGAPILCDFGVEEQNFSFSDSMTIRPQWIFVLL